MPRRSRNRTIAPSAFLTPIDIRLFGDEEKDPCFGKLFDLTAAECQACGDSEFCSVVMAHRLNQKRIASEKADNTNLDLEFSNLKLEVSVKEFIDQSRKSGVSRLLSIKRASDKFKLPKDKIKSIINDQK